MESPSPENRSYRLIIKNLVEESAKEKGGLSFSKLATQTRIQRTYLSQVINLKHHLSNDQIYLVSQVLKLAAPFRSHLILLSEWERCKLESRKRHLLASIEKYEAKQRGERLAQNSAKPDAMDDYFCDPMGEVVLNFISMEKFRKNPVEIQNRIGASPKRWKEILLALEESSFILIQGETIHLLRRPVFPSEQSAEDKIRNIQGRLKVADRKLKQRFIDEFLYNWWFISNPDRKRQLKIQYLHLLQDIYRESLEVPHEDVYQLSIDLISP